MTIVCFLGTVGSGKSTLCEEYVRTRPNDPAVLFLPGRILRSCVGSGFFLTDDGNAPKSCDAFVFSTFLIHMELARSLHRPVVVADGWPRNDLQAAALVEWLHRCDPSVRVDVHHLLCSEKTWEERLRSDRWREDPTLEALDRRRYAASLTDSLGAVAMLRSAGQPFVTVRIVPESQENK
jgi:GTPase SAR1 family protein